MSDLTNPLSEVTVEFIDAMGSDTSIARAAWISTGPDEREKDEARVEGLLRYLISHKHGTPFEHTSLTVRVHAPIMVFREWHRHRIQSYNEQSGRYTTFEPDFYVPGLDRPLINVGTSARPQMGPASQDLHEKTSATLIEAYDHAWHYYQTLLESGIANEVARLVVPVGIYSSMYATANVRAWLHFLGLRTSEENASFKGHPQWEIVQAAKQVEAILTEKFPLTMRLFDEAGRIAP